MTIAPPDSTLNAIRLKVRRLIASPSEQQLTNYTIDQAINTFYQNDFPYGIKLDQMRSVYTFYTSPYQGKYPLNVNFNQGIRAPVYVDGINGTFFKDRNDFYRMWPRFPTLSKPFVGDGTTNSSNILITFTCPTVPFLPGNVTFGGLAVGGSAIRIADDGEGNLYYQSPVPQVSNPSITTNVSGMKNLNNAPATGELGPGDEQQTRVGSVDYVTGVFIIDFSLANVVPASGSEFNLFVSQYQTGRPYSLLFWNNYFEIRPIPKLVHKIEVETYLTPVQFLQITDNPILLQFWQYISYGAAIELARERQDQDSIDNLMEGFKRQEALVLERQATEEIGQRNNTIFTATTQNLGWNQGWGNPYGG